MTIILAKKGMLSLAGSIAVMLGAELGKCSDTLLATIISNREAVKTGLFHLIFNLMSIISGLILFKLFLGLVNYQRFGEHRTSGSQFTHAFQYRWRFNFCMVLAIL